MSLDDRDRSSRLFTVVGAPYVAEQHADDRRHLPKDAELRRPEAGIAGLWLILYGCLAVLSLLGSGGAAKLMEMAGLR